jgi:hypothetical protein
MTSMMAKVDVDTVLLGLGFIAGSSSGLGHHYSLQLEDDWKISGYASVDGNLFDDVKPDPNNIKRIDFTLSSRGTTYRCLSIESLRAHIGHIVADLSRVFGTPDLLRCPKCRVRFVHTKEPRAGQKWKPFLSCEGMMIREGRKDVICDGTSDKLPALICFT